MATSQANPSSEIVVRSSADLAAIEELERILRTGEGPALNVEDDADEAAREIIAQILAAEDDEQTFSTLGTATGWRELLNVPIELAGFNWRPSKYTDEGGQAVFFVVRGTRLDTGANVVLTTGSGTVLAQLTNLAKREQLVGKIVVLSEGDKTKAGYTPLQLRLPKPSDSTEAPF